MTSNKERAGTDWLNIKTEAAIIDSEGPERAIYVWAYEFTYDQEKQLLDSERVQKHWSYVDLSYFVQFSYYTIPTKNIGLALPLTLTLMWEIAIGPGILPVVELFYLGLLC